MDSDKLPAQIFLSKAEILTNGPWCHDSVDITVRLEGGQSISVEFNNLDKGEVRHLLVPSVEARDVERLRDSLNYALQADNSLVISFGTEQGEKHIQRLALATEISEIFWLQVYKYALISSSKRAVGPLPEHIRLRVSIMPPGATDDLCGHKKLTHDEVAEVVQIMDSWLRYLLGDGKE